MCQNDCVCYRTTRRPGKGLPIRCKNKWKTSKSARNGQTIDAMGWESIPRGQKMMADSIFNIPEAWNSQKLMCKNDFRFVFFRQNNFLFWSLIYINIKCFLLKKKMNLVSTSTFKKLRFLWYKLANFLLWLTQIPKMMLLINR